MNDGNAGASEAVIVLLVYVLLGLIALAIDWRALLVSAVVYVLDALNSLFQTYGAVVLPLPAGVRSNLPVVEQVATA